MGMIKDKVREKTRRMISELISKQVYKLINILRNSWGDNKHISVDLQIDVSNITIRYTKITWFGDSADIMCTNTNHTISQKIVTVIP